MKPPVAAPTSRQRRPVDRHAKRLEGIVAASPRRGRRTAGARPPPPRRPRPPSGPGFSARPLWPWRRTSPAITAAAARERDSNRPRSASSVSSRQLGHSRQSNADPCDAPSQRTARIRAYVRDSDFFSRHPRRTRDLHRRLDARDPTGPGPQRHRHRHRRRGGRYRHRARPGRHRSGGPWRRCPSPPWPHTTRVWRSALILCAVAFVATGQPLAVAVFAAAALAQARRRAEHPLHQRAARLTKLPLTDHICITPPSEAARHRRVVSICGSRHGSAHGPGVRGAGAPARTASS